jgi:uncharacterized damage-inducible protein DinB
MTAESEPIATITTVLVTTPSRWQALAQALPEALLSRKPAAGEWSALECLQHIIDVERVFQSRLKAFLDGLESFPAFNPDAKGALEAAARSPGVVAAEFAELRAVSLEAIGKLQPNDLGRTSRHAELGKVTLEEMLNEWPAHDLNHTVQAERALMQPYIQGCGPWQVFFKDHTIGIA